MVRSPVSRSRSNPPGGGGADGSVRVAGFEGIRFTPERSLAEVADRLAIPDSVWSRDDFNILAISGGAAGGAFGAGVLVGLSRAGSRPDFAIVTGVSTGALIAPLAFLGSAWDDRLTEAYTGGHAAQLLGFSRLAPAFSQGLFRAEALESLINPFVDETLMAAVAEQHRQGRRLLVATTNLDAQTTCIWDMGEIATRGGERALTLFREVLIASASLPGLFPPRRFACEADGVAYEEMHVDGGVSAPLFVMPEALLRSKKLGRRLRRSRIYVVVNTVLEQAPRATAPNLAAILIRSFDTMLRFSYRQALNSAAIFCASQDLSLSIASVPDGPDAGNLMNFDTVSMRRIFNAAVDSAQTSDLWLTPTPEPPIWSSLLEALRIDPA
jgi:predicted acylesterase/phospholipase RssA